MPEDVAKDYALEVKVQDKTSVYAGVPENFSEDKLYVVYDGGEAAAGMEYAMKIKVPEGVYIPEKDREVVAVCTLVHKVLKEIELPVTAENIPEGKKVKISPEKIKVSLKGTENLLVAGNLKATIDASKLEENEKTALEVDISTDKEIQIIGTYTASAILE